MRLGLCLEAKLTRWVIPLVWALGILVSTGSFAASSGSDVFVGLDVGGQTLRATDKVNGGSADVRSFVSPGLKLGIERSLGRGYRMILGGRFAYLTWRPVGGFQVTTQQALSTAYELSFERALSRPIGLGLSYQLKDDTGVVSNSPGQIKMTSFKASWIGMYIDIHSKKSGDTSYGLRMEGGSVLPASMPQDRLKSGSTAGVRIYVESQDWKKHSVRVFLGYEKSFESTLQLNKTTDTSRLGVEWRW